MMSTHQTWLLFTLIIILTNLSSSITAQNYGCFGGNYTSNSTYATNLNSLLSSLPPNIYDNGFYNATAGQTPDRAYATALCRTDFQLDSCRTCIGEAADELLRSLCPNRKQGIVFKYTCTLRYSDESIFGVGAESYTIYIKNPQTVSSPDQFNRQLRAVLSDLRGQAAAGGALMKIAAGNETAPDFQTIFAMVQCTPDLTASDCESCLIRSEGFICCDNKTRVIVHMPSCFLEYNVEPFYNMSRLEQVRAMISPPPPFLVPAPPLRPPPGSGDGNTTRTVIIILVPIVASLLIAACVGNHLIKRLMKKPDHMFQNKEEDISEEESLLYDFRELVAATNNFSNANKLGEGGFGVVYKGKLGNGQRITVKRLSKNSGQGELEFKNEVMLMAKLQHRNLVRLLGFSIQGRERLLVYEFLKNASLDSFIFDPVKRLVMNWESRYKIIKGIATGLVYLHEDSRFRIIHRDLKASNILLDELNNPKISDFGMARLFPQDVTGDNINTRRIVGTYGYMAPEYAKNGKFSIKSDVFSFGVLILEIISGQSNGSFKNPENGEDVEYMLSFAWRNWCTGKAKKMIDPVLTSAPSCLHEMLKCIHIGLLCVQENAADRPTMASVLVMLHTFSLTFPVPSHPAFYVPGDAVEEMTEYLDAKPTDFSKNETSFSELYPR